MLSRDAQRTALRWASRLTEPSSRIHPMTRLAAVAVFVAIAVVAAAEPPQPADVRQLVEKLGSPDFTEGEDATKKLEALGAAALDELRPACKSDDPEVARRALDLVRKIERKLANEKTLAPTLVELDAKDMPLDDVLAELSKQAKCEVVVGGTGFLTLAAKKVTVSTHGKVPFWEAVLKVCDAADVRVAGVAGFYAPDAGITAPAYEPSPQPGRYVPPTGLKRFEPNGAGSGQPVPKVRRATNPNAAVVLASRDANTSRRPAAVYGAVLVEAVSKPDAAGDAPAALLQVWPEPRLKWEATSSVKVAKAIDATGARLVADTAVPEPPPPFQVTGNGVVIVRNADGTARVIRGAGPGSDPGYI